MIGKDLVKYHSAIHAPVHYTASLSTFYGASLTGADGRFKGVTGDTQDPTASPSRPFQGHMFIQGCVSATGWLNDDGTCTKLATINPLSGCRPIQICGDHMRGPLHYSHRTITDDISYDYRNAEISFRLDRDTYKTIVCDGRRSFSDTLHITPTHISPGCVSTVKIYVPQTATKAYVKLTFHPDLTWLTNRPQFIMKGYEGIISFESYGTATRDVVCAYAEECYETCPTEIGPCSAAPGLSGFDSIDGESDASPVTQQQPGGSQPLTGCRHPLVFTSWVDDCGTVYNYTLSAGETRTLLYRFDDYYDETGGTSIWNWSASIDPITGKPTGTKVPTLPRSNYFEFKATPSAVPNYNYPPPPEIRLYKSDNSLSSRLVTPPLSSMIYDSTVTIPVDSIVEYLPVEDLLVTKFTRAGGTRYMVVLKCPANIPLIRGRFYLGCPTLLLSHRYIPK